MDNLLDKIQYLENTWKRDYRAVPFFKVVELVALLPDWECVLCFSNQWRKVYRVCLGEKDEQPLTSRFTLLSCSNKEYVSLVPPGPI
jgi:hypothetical protein